MSNTTVIIAALTAFTSTMIGGLFAMRYQKYLHHILGFTGGVILGVIAFDILPEIFEATSHTGASIKLAMVALVAGYLIFHVVEKLLSSHHVHEEHGHEHSDPRIGRISAMALIGHSFLDGVGIGLAFQVSTEVGFAVAVAVIAHDFSDGLNTVSLMLKHGNKRARTAWMLLAAALAPVLGAASTMLFSIPDDLLPIFLGFFAGLLLYIGSSSILPEAHRKSFSWITYFLTIFGAFLMYLVAELAHS